MDRIYNSFVIRCWRSGDQLLQVVVEHIQSGEQARSAGLEAAFDWLRHQAGASPEVDLDETEADSSDENNLSL